MEAVTVELLKFKRNEVAAALERRGREAQELERALEVARQDVLRCQGALIVLDEIINSSAPTGQEDEGETPP